MEKCLYVMMIEKSKTYNKVTKAVIEEHVKNIRNWMTLGNCNSVECSKDTQVWQECIFSKLKVMKRPKHFARWNH